MPFASLQSRHLPRRGRGLARALVPCALLCVGALLLAQPWRTATALGATQPLTQVAAKPATASTTLATSPPAAAFDPASLAGAVLVVAAALFALPLLLRKFGPTARGRGAIDVLEVRPLGGGKSLLLVEVGTRRILVGASEGGMSPLAELGDEELPSHARNDGGAPA